MCLILVFTIYMIFYAITLCFIMCICPLVGPLIWTNKILSVQSRDVNSTHRRALLGCQQCHCRALLGCQQCICLCCGKIIVNNILKFKGVVSLFIFADNHTCAKCKQLFIRVKVVVAKYNWSEFLTQLTGMLNYFIAYFLSSVDPGGSMT
jgi:hypothetical protein